jgi:flagellar biosynthesis anti-sigma factor FlgM
MRVNAETTAVGTGLNAGQIGRSEKVSGGKGGASVTETRDGDQTVLSPQAQDVLVAQKALSQTAESRDKLVADIKAQIESGTFKVDEEVVADRILAGGL